MQAVAWENDCLWGKAGEKPGLNRIDDGLEIPAFIVGGAWPTGEQSVATEENVESFDGKAG